MVSVVAMPRVSSEGAIWFAVISLREMTTPDQKQALRASVRAAQARYESEAEAARRTRREAFAEPQQGGLSLSDIAEEVGLHRSRIGQIIEGK